MQASTQPMHPTCSSRDAEPPDDAWRNVAYKSLNADIARYQSAMTFEHLLSAEIYRDGGSYRAALRSTAGGKYELMLRRSRMPDAAGLHHRWLLVTEPGEPSNASGATRERAVVTGSEAERRLLEALRAFIANGRGKASQHDWERLTEMVEYITVRESCSQAEARAEGFLEYVDR